MNYFTDLNSIDIFIVAFSAICVLAGVVRGFTKDILGLMSWFGTIFVSCKLLPLALPITHQWIENPTLSKIITLVILFVIVFISFVLIIKGISMLIQNSILGGVDRTFGIFSGLVRSGVLLTLIYLSSVEFLLNKELPDAAKKSKLLWIIKKSSKQAIKYMPELNLLLINNFSDSLQSINEDIQD